MKIIVNDTNIFIDLQSVGLLRKMCELPYEIHTVDFIIEEIIDPDQRAEIDTLIEEDLIKVRSFSAIEVADIVTEHALLTGNLSIPDCAVCYYARKSSLSLITGDRQLRLYAISQDVEVHGVLYIFDLLVETRLLTKAKAAISLKKLYQLNCRLPKAEIEKRLNQWQ